MLHFLRALRAIGLPTRTVVLATLSTLLLPVATADVLTTTDGRTFEGNTLSDTADAATFETMISGIKATLTFKRSQIKSLEKKSLAARFFEEAETTPPTATAPTQADSGLYLEIPIRGAFRETIFAQAVRSTLAHAKLKKVRHVVFTVDSTGGPIDEAAAIYKTLQQFKGNFRYHAILDKCLGGALVIPFQSETIHIRPGATIGGIDQDWESVPRKYAGQEEAVVRAQIADNLAAEARRRGRPGFFIRAMINPNESLAAWTDNSGQIVFGPTPPADLPSDAAIFVHPAGSPLVLTFDQAITLGMPGFEGGPDKLGAALGVANWKEESSYGRDTMNRHVAQRQRRIANAQAAFEDNVTRNIRMRESTNSAIEHNLKQAAAWNPTEASYATISKYWNAYWDPEATFDTSLWTPESRQRWRDRTEACMYYLSQARAGIQSMMRLDKEALTLGLSSTYQEDQLKFMLDDVESKLTMLRRHQNRAGQ